MQFKDLLKETYIIQIQLFIPTLHTCLMQIVLIFQPLNYHTLICLIFAGNGTSATDFTGSCLFHSRGDY